MAETMTTVPSSFNDAVDKEIAWKAAVLKQEGRMPLHSPAFSSCSTSVPFSPAGSLGLPSPVASRLVAEAPEPIATERQLSWGEEGFAAAKPCDYFDDDDSDDDILPGKPLWSYSGPSLEELLAAEKCENEMQSKSQYNEEHELGEEEEANKEEDYGGYETSSEIGFY